MCGTTKYRWWLAATLVNKPNGYIFVCVFTSDGEPIPGCEIRFDGSGNPPTLSTSQDGRMVFVGVPGSHEATVVYPGCKPVHQSFEFTPIDKDGNVIRSQEPRIQLQRSEG